jgi:hypothetical protein
MKRRVLGYLPSAGSVYLTMSFLTKVFVDLVNNLTLSVIYNPSTQVCTDLLVTLLSKFTF